MASIPSPCATDVQALRKHVLYWTQFDRASVHLEKGRISYCFHSWSREAGVELVKPRVVRQTTPYRLPHHVARHRLPCLFVSKIPEVAIKHIQEATRAEQDSKSALSKRVLQDVKSGWVGIVTISEGVQT